MFSSQSQSGSGGGTLGQIRFAMAHLNVYCHANTRPLARARIGVTALVTLDMPTSRCHIFQRKPSKLNFLQRLVTPEALESNRIGPATTKTFAVDIEDLCLVKECKSLDSMFNSDLTTKVLTDDCNQREMKRIIQSLDKEVTLEKCTSKAPPDCSSCHQRRELAKIVGLCQSLGLKTFKGPTKPN